MAIMIGAEYYGGVIRSVRHHNNISANQFAHLLGVNLKQLHRYEEGRDLIPRDTLRRVFKYAAMMDAMMDKK